ncbi:peptidylprolyl isomerase [Paralcaligenes sp. KSB-10]|uniref:peptidylprolyl isomerase n=1 Tax=Paralcaligenes sp. KSB-10 TaxID=2901142 RepID=UPI001E5A3914|nr:peptidylprolyl isomerase [Paralcaligenes sp. KSB-10]UHL66274.1 peptidylprolyl isomerase [Paralcaligenes sp. KSB-10]
MMRSLHTKHRLAFVLIPILGLLSSSPAWAAKAAPHHAASARTTPQSEQFVDGIAAVVNKKVITLGQVNAEAQSAAAQLKRQKIAVPDTQTLQKQVLQRMIATEVERQEAERLGIKVTDAELQQAVDVVAKRNKLSTDRLRQEVQKTGVTWDNYLKSLREEVLFDQLRQRAVDSTIVISDADVDAFIKNQEAHGGQMAVAPPPEPTAAPEAPPVQQTGPVMLGLAQILVAVPEGSSPQRVQELRQKAEAILAKLRGGADFASVAAASSDDQQALKGGDLGVRPVEGWPDLFIQATQKLRAGQISGIIQSGNGFHILKVLKRGQAQSRRPAANTAPVRAPAPAANQPAEQQGPVMVTQTHARHILIKVSKVMSDTQAQTLLNDIRQRIEHGEKFADLAKRYSQDSSAPQGGDLGWLNPGETVPPFEQAMNALQPGQISQPVRSPFGWHLIEVEGRRTKDMANEYKRMQARKILFQRREQPAFEDWLNRLIGEAYIDNRLDPQSNRRPSR